MGLTGRAYMLEPVDFHREFTELFAALSTPEGFVQLRARATRLWHSDDPVMRGYIELLHTATPEDWEAGLDEGHVVDWYRILMAGYLIPTPAFHWPDLIKRRLPDLGWSPAEARRLAWGRELQLLAEAHGTPELASRLALHFTLGHKGWLSQDDVETALARLRALDRARFRRNQDLIPVVENAYEVLEAAVTKPDHVLLLVSE